MITADAIDRHMREQQHRGWVAAEEARFAAAGAPRRPPLVRAARTSIRAGQNGRCKPPAACVGRRLKFLGARFAGRPSVGRWQPLPQSPTQARSPSRPRASTSSRSPARRKIRPIRPRASREASSTTPRPATAPTRAPIALPLHPRTAAVASVAPRALRRQRLPRCPGGGRCEPHRRHRVAARGATARPTAPARTGPSPAATTARFPRGEPATLSAARRQAPQAAHTAQRASRRALDQRDPPRAAAAAASPCAESHRAWLRARPGPHVAVPARPLPTRVAPDAPPEFM